MLLIVIISGSKEKQKEKPLHKSFLDSQKPVMQKPVCVCVCGGGGGRVVGLLSNKCYWCMDVLPREHKVYVDTVKLITNIKI